MRSGQAIDRRNRRARRGRHLVVALAAVLWTTLGARAQMLPFVPDPVTTPELSRYADMLGLSDAQRLAALDVHDAYRREFRALEDGKVKAFVEDLTGLARVFTREGFRIPPRSDFENLIEQLDAIFTKAKTIDRSLFDRLAPILTETQLAILPSVRTEREMDIYSHLMDAPGELNPGAPIVLSSLVRELDRSAEEIARTEESLRQYERRAVERMRKLYRLLEEAAELALDTLDRTGLRDMTPMEMMQLGDDEAFEADVRATFDDGSKPLQAELFAASEDNLRLLRQLTPLLAPDNAETLRDRYYRAAYRRAYRERAPWRDAYTRALALGSLDAERREQVGAMREQYRRQEDLLIDGVVDRVEASREYRTVEQMEREDEDDLQRRIADFREDRASLGVSALAALGAVLTPAEMASVEPGERDGRDPSDDAILRATTGGGGGERADERDLAVEVAESEARADFDVSGMPAAMPVARRDQLARLARLDGGRRPVLDALYDDYRAAYREALERMTQEDEAKSDEEDGDPKERAKKRDEQRAARRAELAALDATLFESMGLVLEGETATTVVRVGRRLRERERATEAARSGSFMFGREESYVDPVGVVLALDESVEVVAAARAMIDRYGETVGPLVDERLAALAEAMRLMRAASLAEGHGLPGGRVAKRFAEKAGESRRKVTALDGRIRDENRRLLDEIESALGPELGWTLRVAYQREAFPEVYEDELGMDETLAAVRALDDLAAPQRAQVERIVNDYRSAFSKVRERMVQLRRQRNFDFNAMQMPSQEVIEGEIELERLRFDRREAASRALLRLRLVLDDSQIARSRLRGLPAGDRRAFD